MKTGSVVQIIFSGVEIRPNEGEQQLLFLFAG